MDLAITKEHYQAEQVIMMALSTQIWWDPDILRRRFIIQNKSNNEVTYKLKLILKVLFDLLIYRRQYMI